MWQYGKYLKKWQNLKPKSIADAGDVNNFTNSKMKMDMKSTAVLFVAAILTLGACQNKEQALTQSEIDAKVDSLVGLKMEEINRQAMEDLDRRMAIEVKAKADSIVQARMQTPAQ
jgi:hypothetical protein